MIQYFRCGLHTNTFGGKFSSFMSEITDPPKKLYIKGEFPIAKKYSPSSATEKPSSYGKDAVKTLIGRLTDFAVVIVSGLALGTDALAHEAALENNIFDRRRARFRTFRQSSLSGRKPESWRKRFSKPADVCFPNSNRISKPPILAFRKETELWRDFRTPTLS